MKLADINRETEDLFFRCLHAVPPDPRVLEMRRAWREIYQPRGHRAKVLLDDHDEVVGLTNYIPVEHSPFRGRGLMAILCVWISQPSRGYGRYVLSEIERDARASGCAGVVVAGNEFNPASFYEHMGYLRVEQSGLKVLLWKPFRGSAQAPQLLERKAPLPRSYAIAGKVQVVGFTDGWCHDGCDRCVMVRDVVQAISTKADLTEVLSDGTTDVRTHGESHDAVYIDGVAFRPDGPPATAAEFEQACLARYTEKNQ